MQLKGPTKGLFETIYADGKRVSGTGIRIHALPGSGRIGVGSAKKIGAKPQRNRVKRRLLEAVRASGQLDGRFDWVVVVGQVGATLDLPTLREQWQNLSGRLVERWENEWACSS